MREKCPKTDFFPVPIFRNSPNTGKYKLEKTPYLDTFYAVRMSAPYI